jgi:hypothetical protein
MNHLFVVFDVKNKNTKLIDFTINQLIFELQIVKYSTGFEQKKAA